jgi:hypothetical protein
MHFGENQLSPGSIGISPLSTGHPPVLQHWWVRASTGSHPRCTLPMDSSPGFGSHPHDAHALFRLAFAPAPRLSGRLTCQAPVYGPRRADALVGSFYKRHAVTPAAQGRQTGSDCLSVRGFRISFHPPHGVLFTFPSRYSFPIGGQWYCALEGGPPSFPRDFSGPVVLRVAGPSRPPSPTGLSPPAAHLPRCFG